MVRFFNKKTNGGFTLIELVVVMAILIALALLLIPQISAYADQAKEKSDQASLKALNKATSSYAIFNNKSEGNVFAHVSSNDDLDRMQVLVDEGLLAKVVVAQQKSVEFQWGKLNNQYTWKLSGVTTEPGLDPDPNPDPDSGEEGEIIPPVDLGMSAERAKELGFTFNESQGVITGYDVSKGVEHVIIPSKINGISVTIIAENAFSNKGIKLVEIPDSVTSIGKQAFEGNRLTEVVLPTGLRTLGDNSFTKNNIKSVLIPESVTNMAYPLLQWYKAPFYDNGDSLWAGTVRQISGPGLWKINGLSWQKE